MNARHRTTAALTAVVAMVLGTLTALAPRATAAPPPLSASFTHWTQRVNGGAELSVTADSAAQEGDSALKIVNNSARKPDVYGFLAQSIPVKPSTTYEFTAWARSDGLPNLGIQITLSPDWNERYTFPSGSYGWTEKTWTYTTKAGQTTLDYRVLSQDTTPGFWLDGLTVTAAGSDVNLLRNGGFERHSPPNLITSPSLVFTRGQASVDLRTLPGIAGPAHWQVTDEQHRPVDSGTTSYTQGAGTIGLDHLGPGYYHLDVTLDAGSQPATSSTPFAVLDPLPAAAQRPESPFGVAVHLGDGNAMNARLAALAKQAGIAHARSDVSWNRVEKSPGQYTFPQGYDTDWKNFAEQGVRPLLLSTYRNPLYDGGRTPSSPEGLAAYAAYTSALLDQYGHLTRDVEVYNEFNINFNDGACGRTPDCYYDMLRTTAERVKADHPDATVVGPATSGLSLDWVEQLLELGGAKHLDAVTVHPYRHPNAPEGIDDEMTALSRVIKKHNDGESLPIWLTELGWPTPEGGGTTRLQQADHLIRAQTLALGNGVERFYWYELMSSGTDPHEKEHHFGLLSWQPPGVTQALPPKEAYVAQSVMTRKLAGRPYSGRDAVTEPAYSYRFGRGADTVRVMWAAPDARSATLRADGPLTVTDSYGRSTRLVPVGGVIRLDLDERPVFVEGQVEDVAVTDAPALSLSAPPRAATGDRIPVRLTVDRTGDAGRGLPGTLTLGVEGAEHRVRAPQGKKTTVTVDVAAGERIQDRHIVAELGPGNRSMARLTATTGVREPVTLEAEPEVTAASPAAGQVRITLTNNRLATGLPVDALEWTIGTQSGARTDLGAVPPGGARSVRIPVDDVTAWEAYEQRITARLPGRKPLTLTGTTGFNPVEPDGAGTAPPIDLGRQAKWSQYTRPWGGTADLSGSMRVAYTDDALVLTADVTDDVFAQDNPASTMYNGDSVQFAVSPEPPGRSSQMTEIGLARTREGPAAYTYMAFGNAMTGPTSGARTSVTREGSTTSYRVGVPWASLGFTGRPERPIGFSVMVNDNDGKGRAGFMEWGSGIGRTKDTALFRPVQLMS
ncbi:sugar-binding protein [Streptomyces viridiviolaceus]